MKILITGATGLVGQALTEQLLERGDEVNYLTTRPSKIKNQDNYKGYKWDTKSSKHPQKLF